MHPDYFNAVVAEVLSNCQNTLSSKGAEYAPDADRLHNFRIGAAIKKESMHKTLAGMMVKHTTSLYDMCMGPTPQEFPIDLWNEKIVDHINYLILLKAIIVEEQEV